MEDENNKTDVLLNTVKLLPAICLLLQKEWHRSSRKYLKKKKNNTSISVTDGCHEVTLRQLQVTTYPSALQLGDMG